MPEFQQFLFLHAQTFSVYGAGAYDKILQQNADKDCVLVLPDITGVYETAGIYGLDKKIRWVSADVFREMAKAGQLKGKSLILDPQAVEPDGKLAAFCKPGYIIRDYVSGRGSFIFMISQRISCIIMPLQVCWKQGQPTMLCAT